MNTTDLVRLLHRFSQDYELSREEMAIICGLDVDRYSLIAEGWLDAEPQLQDQILMSLGIFAERMGEIDKDINLN